MRLWRLGHLLLTAEFCLMSLGCGSSVKPSTDTSSSSSGGGTSSSSSSPVSVTITGTSSVRIGSTVQFTALVNSSATGSVNWAVNGVSAGNSTIGTISTAGLYTPPAVLPTPNTVTITATTKTSPASSGSLTESILNPVPVLNAVLPTVLLVGTDNTVKLSGSGYVNGSSILVNGTPASVTGQSSSQLTATVSGALLKTGFITFAVKNPDPDGSTSNTVTVSTSDLPSDSVQVNLTPGREVPQDFLGTSYEWGDSEWVMGWPAVKVNTIYRQLLKNLTDGHDAPFSIRIGGGTTDQTGLPTDQTMPAFASLASDVNVRFSFGVNFSSGDVNLATAQAQAYVSQMPTGTVDAIEIGNEPDDYGYVGLRSAPYSTSQYLQDYATWRQSILPILPKSTHFMGPSWGELRTLVQHLSDFEAQEAANTSIISHHLYAGYQDNGATFASDYLLTPAASTAGPASIASEIALAHSKGQAFRIGEFNSIDSGGVSGVSDAFGSALWAVDTMFEYANVGLDGVNWHGISDCTYCAFTFQVVNGGPHGNTFSLTQVKPLYYGMLLFEKATGNHAKLLPVTLQTKSNIKVWATMDRSNTVYVVIVNKDESFSGGFAVMLSGYGDAQAIRLTAPSYQSTTGVTLGGQTFDGSADGNPVGTPASETILAESGIYNVNLQPTSAVLLVLKK